MLILCMFRNLKTVIVLDDKNGYIIQNENFKNKAQSCQYSIINEIFTEKDIETLICNVYKKNFVEILENIVDKNENYSGSITGSRKELLEEFSTNATLLVALDLLVRSKCDFTKKEVILI